MSSVIFEERKINADRICDAISRIGYRPHAAITDIVDNSVAAHAAHVEISIELEEGSTLNEKNNIEKLTIIDNGKGMNDDEVRIALDLGSLVEYEENSLSKYGLGLKSAGFSLGDKVLVLSKQNNVLTKQYSLDRDVIRREGAYGVCVESPTEDLLNFLREYETGTVVQIQKTHSPQDSARTVIKNLDERLGVIYFKFINRENEPLVIKIKYADKVDFIQPLDILFLKLAKSEFDPDNYDGLYPRMVVDDVLSIYDSNGSKRDVPLKIVIFPKNDMQKYVGFSEDEKEMVKSL